MALPDENALLKKEYQTDPDVAVVVEEDAEVEVDIQDDTPPEDRNKKALPEGAAEPTEEEMEQYSEAVKARIGKLKHSAHDERRAKEAAIRERDEAVTIAQRIFQEKKALEARYVQGENAFIVQTKEKADLAMANAKREYKAAYEIGDADAMADAQEKMASIAADRKEAEVLARNAAVRKEKAGQEEKDIVQSQPTPREMAPRPDPEAADWAAKNRWFGIDKVMTGAAYGVHDELIEEGISPNSDAYYKNLNTRLRSRFPTYDWGDAPKKKPISVVAPVTRTTGSAKRVVLTQSQVNVARRLNLTPQQYAVELLKLENA